jgi:hypothetical protein
MTFHSTSNERVKSLTIPFQNSLFTSIASLRMSDFIERPPATNEEMKPDLGAMARELLKRFSTGALATQSIKHNAFPFVSQVPFAVDDQGRPLIFVSALATHTRNLKANSNASLLATAGDSLADARATLVGTVPRELFANSASALRRC